MLFAESPLGENQLVAVDETECFIERSAGAWRQNYVGKSAVRFYRFDCTPAADSSGKQIAKRAGHRRFGARVDDWSDQTRME